MAAPEPIKNVDQQQSVAGCHAFAATVKGAHHIGVTAKA